MPETHMLKPYADRVNSTYAFMMSMIEFLNDRGSKLVGLKKKAIENQRKASTINLNWEVDKEKVESLKFKGYEAKRKESKISSLQRLYYDRSKKYTKEVDFYNSYKPNLLVELPEAYVIPQAYEEVIERLKWNDVIVDSLRQDTELFVEMYYIEDYDTTNSPYEGHYLHSKVETRKVQLRKQFYKGDFVVKTDQEKINYAASVLEPKAPDSYFAWNFFDGILMQKEYFSDYVFEDRAVEILNQNPRLREMLEQMKNEDKEFANNGRAQLNYIYRHSEHYEKTHNRYPVARVLKSENDK